MAIYHLSMKPIQRSAGRSAIASAAYRSGERLHDPRQNLSFDYSRKERILHKSIIGPTSLELNRQLFWGAVELHHKRGDAVTAREVEVALPHEVSDSKKIYLAKSFAEHLASKYGCAVDFAVHTSKGQGDNYHCHFLMSAVSFTNGVLGKKIDNLDPIWCSRNGLEAPAESIRKEWEIFTNALLKNERVKTRVDHRSYERQGINKIPTKHEGPRSRPGWKERHAENKRIKHDNWTIDFIDKEIAKYQSELDKELERQSKENQARLDEAKEIMRVQLARLHYLMSIYEDKRLYAIEIAKDRAKETERLRAEAEKQKLQMEKDLAELKEKETALAKERELSKLKEKDMYQIEVTHMTNVKAQLIEVVQYRDPKTGAGENSVRQIRYEDAEAPKGKDLEDFGQKLMETSDHFQDQVRRGKEDPNQIPPIKHRLDVSLREPLSEAVETAFRTWATERLIDHSEARDGWQVAYLVAKYEAELWGDDIDRQLNELVDQVKGEVARVEAINSEEKGQNRPQSRDTSNSYDKGR